MHPQQTLVSLQPDSPRPGRARGPETRSGARLFPPCDLFPVRVLININRPEC